MNSLDNITLANKLLATLLRVNHLVFPFQMWMCNTTEYLEANESTQGTTSAYFSIIVAYTVASSVTNGSLLRAICCKMCLIAAVAVFISHSCELVFWPVMGLAFEATLAGAFEGSLFDMVFSAPLDPQTRQIRLIKLLVVTLVGHLLLPRLLSTLGLTSHLSLNIKADAPHHMETIMFHAILKEALIFFLPNTFARLSSRTVPGRGRYLSKQPITAADANSAPDAPSRITGLHQIILWGILCFAGKIVDDTLSSIFHPLSAFQKWYALTTRVFASVEQLQRRLSQMLRLALLGRIHELPALDLSLAAVLRRIGDVQLYMSFWLFCSLILSSFWYYFVRR